MHSLHSRILPWLGERLTGHAPAVLVLLTVLVVGVSSLIPRLQFDFSPQALFETNETLMQRSEDFKEIFGHTENLLTILYVHPDVTRADALADLAELSSILDAWDEVDRVDSLTFSALPRAQDDGVVLEALWARAGPAEPSVVEEARAMLQHSWLVRGRLASREGTLAVIALQLREDQLPAAQLVPLLDRVDAVLAETPLSEEAETSLGGIPAVRGEAVRRLMREQMLFVPLSVFVSSLVLFFLYRSGRAVAMPVLTVLGAVGVSVGLMSAIGEPINILNNTLTTLLYTIGLSDAVHVLSRFREERARAETHREAAVKTFEAMAVACFLTSLTTAVGFLSLATSNTDILQRFGVTCAVGILIAYLLTITLLPSALSVFGLRSRQAGKGGQRGRRSRLEAWLEALTRQVITHPRKVVACSTVLVIGLLPGVARVQVDSAMLELFPAGDPMNTTTHLQETQLDGVLPIEVSLRSSQPGRFEDPDILNAIERAMDRGLELEGVLAATSMTTWMREIWVVWTGNDQVRDRPFTSRAQTAQLLSLLEDRRSDPLAPWLTLDRSHARIQFRVADIGGRTTLALADEIKALLTEELEGQTDLRVLITGDAWTGSMGLLELIGDFVSSISWAFVFIFGFMVLTFRSLRLGLISIPANVIPLLLTLSVMGMAGIWLNTTTVILFSISLGLAVDDSIHYLARYGEMRRRGADRDEAILAAARGAGRAIVFATLLIGMGLAVLSTSSFVPTQRFALLTGLTLVGCLIADLILLPALLHLFGEPSSRNNDSVTISEP